MSLVDRWRTGCERQPQSAEQMEELVDSVWSVVRQGNECEDQWEGSRTVVRPALM